MKSPLSPRLRRRVAGSAAALALLGGALFYWSQRPPGVPQTAESKSVPPTLDLPEAAPITRTPAADAAQAPPPAPHTSTVVENSSLAPGRRFNIALDQIAALTTEKGEEKMVIFPLKPLEDRAKLSEVAAIFSEDLKALIMPVLYDTEVERQQASRSFITGRIIASLQPGADPGQIAQDYDLKDLGPAGAGAYRAYQAAEPVLALAKLEDLRADSRIVGADHSLIRPLQVHTPDRPRFFPRDRYFFNQWHLLSSVGPTAQPLEWLAPGQTGNGQVIPVTNPPVSGIPAIRGMDLNLFPTGAFIPTALVGLPFSPAPVWGDWDSLTDGYRGRNVIVAILDDGIDRDHPEFLERFATSGHRMLRLAGQDVDGNVLTYEDYLVETRENQVDHNKTQVGGGHGTVVAGVIAANADNNQGVAGIAPQASLMIFKILHNIDAAEPDHYPNTFRVLNYLNAYYKNGSYDPVFFADVSNKLPIASDKALAKAFALNVNEGADGPVAHIKNCSWGLADSLNLYDGPGPELIKERENAVLTGRAGKGTIFVHSAGNGRTNMGNANYDGYVNTRFGICVAAIANPRDAYPADNAMDWCTMFSEWGSCVTVSGAAGGPYFGPQLYKEPLRVADGFAQAGSIFDNVRVYSTDWTINRAINGVDFYGWNAGPTGDDLSDGDYTKTYNGTSAAAAEVSGVVALMLEANPRLSWLDVQDILIRTARNHKTPLALLLNPADPSPTTNLNALNGIDWSDPNEPSVVDRDWVKNTANIWWNHKYGAGLVNARAALNRVMGQTMIPLQDVFSLSGTNNGKFEVADTNALGSPGAVTEIPLSIQGATAQFRATHVELKFDKIRTSAIGDLNIRLQSPGGTISILSEPHYDASDDLVGWTFMTNHNWGEGLTPTHINGQWKVLITDTIPFDQATVNPTETGKSYRVTLKVHGFNAPPATPTIQGPALREYTVVVGKLWTDSFSALGDPTGWTWVPPAQLPPPAPAPPPFASEISLAPYPTADTLQPDATLQGVFTEIGTYEGRLRAVNYANNYTTTISEVTVRFNVISDTDDAYTVWARSTPFFGGTAAANPLAWGDQDPDGDGVINVLEFALGGHPTINLRTSLYQATLDGLGRPVLTFNRYPTRGTNTYEVEISHDLVTWTLAARSTNRDPFVQMAPSVLIGEGPLILTPTNGTVQESRPEHRSVQIIDDSGTGPTFFRIRVIPYRNATPQIIAPIP